MADREGDLEMADVTGRDDYIIKLSLAYAYEAIERMPQKDRCVQKDLDALLRAMCLGDYEV